MEAEVAREAEAAVPAAESAKEAEAETSSHSSEWECPVCYQQFCEPVLAGCGRHTFCRNCLLRSQRCGSMPRCPVCRAESLEDASNVPEVVEIVQALRRRDPRYEEKAAAARRDREEQLRLRSSARGPPEPWNGRGFEVCGAGSDVVNGIYVPGTLPTYVGPMVYRKPNTYLFIYRWHQTQWVIAELRGPYSMGNEREWLYHAPTQQPPDIPPTHGWEVPQHGRAANPAPEVRGLRPGTTGNTEAPVLSGTGPRRRTRGVTSGAAAVDLGPAPWPPGALEPDAQARCRCAPSCCVM